jgi:hypothetical protein
MTVATVKHLVQNQVVGTFNPSERANKLIANQAPEG